MLAVMLAPVAHATNVAEGLRRVWAYARLSAAVPSRLDPSVVVLGTPEIRGSGNIWLGSNLYLYRELYLETQGEGRIEIGDNVVISRGAHIVSFALVSIGANSMIGEYTSIRDANHRFENGTPIRDSGHHGAPIAIGRNVWLGRGVAVLAGVTIGDNAVVGANAVVTKDVEEGSVVAGVPAQPIRRTARA